MIRFNKRLLNPLILKFAGTAPSPFAVIQHIGRRSGKRYQTPIIVRPTAGGFVIALTYGPAVDWYRNWQATGRATLLWHGRIYTLAPPEPLHRAAALLAFPAPMGWILQRTGTRHFVHIQAKTAGNKMPLAADKESRQ